MQEKLLQWICCPICQCSLQLNDPSFSQEQTITSGTLSCVACCQDYPLIEGVPWLLEPRFFQQRESTVFNTAKRYSFLWERSAQGYGVKTPRHIERVVSLLTEEPFQGSLGIDAGAGLGDDTEYLASQFPNLTLLSLDISFGVNRIQKRIQRCPNVHVIRASVLQLPLKNHLADFVYSYGVLHHTSDPRKGFSELARVLKPKGTMALYLYEDHSRDWIKRKLLKLVRLVRKITVRVSPRILFGICWMLSPVVVICFSLPARFLRRFRLTRGVADRIPFNFGSGLWSVTGDLYDRLSAPEEFRFSKQTIQQWYTQAKFDRIQIVHLKDIAGLVSVGRRVE